MVHVERGCPAYDFVTVHRMVYDRTIFLRTLVLLRAFALLIVLEEYYIVVRNTLVFRMFQRKPIQIFLKLILMTF